MTLSIAEMEFESVEFVPPREVMWGGGCYSPCGQDHDNYCHEEEVSCDVKADCLDVCVTVKL